MLAAGVSDQQIKDALAVAFAFNVTDRLAYVFDFAVDDPAAINAGAKYLLARGLPVTPRSAGSRSGFSSGGFSGGGGGGSW